MPISLSRLSLFFFTAFLLYCQSVSGQWNETTMQSIPLENLDFFKPVSKNWKIESKARSLREISQQIETEPGIGVLVNRPDATAKDNLETKAEYSDLDLEMELMLPNNTNSGIYLMGRYEVQLFDSWGKENPTFGDCGGIYERWDPNRGKGREGHEGFAPLTNECKAPGLWQTLRISFEAPRFDGSGKKIKNARFLAVWLNGIKIQSMVEMSGPTRGALTNEEKPLGPILIQGDHGPIAFRHIKMAEYGMEQLQLENLNYKVWLGQFKSLSLPPDAQLRNEGKGGELLTKNILDSDDDYYLEYLGKIKVINPGLYEFSTLTSGRSALVIDNDTVVKTHNSTSWWDKRKGSVQLSAGEHSFKLINSKSDADKKSCLGLSYTGPGIREQNLHTEGSIATGTGSPTLSLEKEANPYVQRSFYYHNNVRKAYGINVADPSGQHFTLNANTGRLNRVWRGDEVGDVTSMWVDRGSNQILVPKSATLQLTDKAVLGLSPENYADTLMEKDGFKYTGYRQLPGQQPVFTYTTQWGELELQAILSARNFTWEGTLKPTGGSTKPYHLVAEGIRIELLKDGSYLVDEQLYIIPDKKLETISKITDSQGIQKLYIQLADPGTDSRFRYRLVW